MRSDFMVPPPPATMTTPATQPAVPADEQPASQARPPREKNQTGHAGLVGWITFVLAAMLLLLPLLPGKIILNFPLASNTFSAGDSALGCTGTPANLRTSTAYTKRAGSPITYTYTTSTTQTATCDGRQRSTVTGHTSQFNPLGLVVDIVTALAAAIVVARAWRLVFGEKKRNRPSEHDE